MSSLAGTCPACRQPVQTEPFYRCTNVPANSVSLCDTANLARTMNKGNISLIHCLACGFIFNAEYNSTLCIYDDKYEETQAHSNVFNLFNHELAIHLLNSYQLRNKNILEIGCGKGDFLNLICAMGDNNGVGFDPTYVAERSQSVADKKVTIYNQFFPENYAGPEPDCIICRMTMEHIPNVHDFLNQIHKSITPGSKPVIFFQVPDAGIILDEARFWDIYYEHCSYFTSESLARLFQQSGFQIIDISSGYDRQYLMIEAIPVHDHSGKQVEINSFPPVTSQVESFSAATEKYIPGWQRLLHVWQEQKKNVILWGGGSKAVAFLTTLNISSKIHSTVDINPHKQNRFLPGTGHRVIAPRDLIAIKPDIILVMNPVYMTEITDYLRLLHVDCELLPLSQENLTKTIHH